MARDLVYTNWILGVGQLKCPLGFTVDIDQISTDYRRNMDAWFEGRHLDVGLSVERCFRR